MNRTVQNLALALAAGTWLLSANAAETKAPKCYDGEWWSLADSEERSGFVDGAADCFIFIVHEKLAATHTNKWIVARITEYYKTHHSDNTEPVVKVWHKAISVGPPEAPPLKGGEVFTNPHGYYDGLFWRGSSSSERKGFLEGYLSCFQMCVQSPSETYSQSINYYIEKINGYVEKHPESDNEAIAQILSRFRDKLPTTNRQPKKP